MTRTKTRRLSAGSFLTDVQLAAAAAARPEATLTDQLFDMVVHQIRAGQLAAGRRIASVRQLAEDCGVSRETAAKAYDKLVAHGFLESRPRSGFYVTTLKAPHHARAAPASPRVPAFASNSFRARMVNSDGLLDTTLGGGHLPDDWLEPAGVAAALRQVCKGNLRYLNKFSGVFGYAPLRDQLRLKLRDLGIAAEADQIMVTFGATEALSLIVQAYLCTPREIVLVDTPASFMLQERLAASGLDVKGVNRLADGPDVEQLRLLCEKHRPRFFFVHSILHNPTSSSIAAHKAFQILRLAEEFDLTIVEDDTYGDLASPARSSQFARLSTLDQLRRVIYIGSFSKTLGSGLRIGFFAAAADKTAWLGLHRYATKLSGNSLMERAVYQLLSSGSYRHHCELLRGRLDAQREGVFRNLEQRGFTLVQRHDAGMFAWAHLPQDADDTAVANEMLRRGYLTAPGHVFAYDPQVSTMRFNIATATAGGALDVLTEVIEQTVRNGQSKTDHRMRQAGRMGHPQNAEGVGPAGHHQSA